MRGWDEMEEESRRRGDTSCIKEILHISMRMFAITSVRLFLNHVPKLSSTWFSFARKRVRRSAINSADLRQRHYTTVDCCARPAQKERLRLIPSFFPITFASSSYYNSMKLLSPTLNCKGQQCLRYLKQMWWFCMYIFYFFRFWSLFLSAIRPFQSLGHLKALVFLTRPKTHMSVV